MSAAAPIGQLKKSWDKLGRLGPKFGYYPEGSKSWLVIRKNTEKRAESIFPHTHTNVKITTEDKRHLGAVIETTNYRQSYVKEKIDQWIRELRILRKRCYEHSSEPQAAYWCFRHKPTYFM